jgi:hypothetical protein
MPTGVYEVDDQLKVNLIGESRREDDESRGVALQSLLWETEIPPDTVDVRVASIWITLKVILISESRLPESDDGCGLLREGGGPRPSPRSAPMVQARLRTTRSGGLPSSATVCSRGRSSSQNR